ncbi:hypothetical protein KDA14_05235, partial [Candidatus Saccharibacteria bacterium]|nr:hypothetical protein [Candidatus Saccharibacteria bacterium]
NVITFTPTPPPAPVAKCTGLDEPKVVNKDQLIYSFTAQAKVDNAKLVSGKFDYGDGTKQSGTVKSTTLVGKHQYKKGGKYTIVATLKFSAYDKTLSDTCQTKLTITVPYYSCVQLGGEVLDKDTFSYRYTASMKYGNGAEFVSANFDFGDGQTVSGVKSADGKTVSADHAYNQAGEYHAFATLQFNVNGKTVTAPACRAFVTPTTPPTPECKPGIPVGDIRCNPCEYDASITADDEDCVAPEATELPNTGAGNVIAMSSVALIGGFLWYRHMLFKRHKAAYVAAEADMSPLPLAEPLETDTPLADTPLAHQKKRLSLRRNRRF